MRERPPPGHPLHWAPPHDRSSHPGPPNYSFEKRQREIAAKKQKEEKLAKKQQAREAAKAANQPAGEHTPSDPLE
ncbi:hypothetical protein [Thermomonas sp.]|uniref:hypothetical protein n=1 Tax=Thermomonas sp. TaxID=1971895 RepID=UPI00261B09FA|nr:hypothetical protein [Thermomonas sp.]MBL0227688.1 hypothetical protein [Thermomonas sp.]